MLQAGATIKGVKKVQRWLEKNHADAEKAMNTALKVEGFRLRTQLQREIRAGAPGGKPFAPLSYIRRGLHRRRMKPDNPMATMAKAVRYAASSAGGQYTVKVGFIQPGAGFHGISKRWIALAKMHQEGFTREVSPKMRKMIVRWGARLGTVEGGDTPFFLRRSTRRFNTPPRPIVAPFWASQINQTRRNVERNFAKKLKGQRI